MRYKSALAAACFTILALCTKQSFSVEEMDPQQLRPDGGESELICVANHWAVWRTSELIEKTAGYCGRFYVHRFYRQRISEPLANFAFRGTGLVAYGRNMTIESDGAIVFVERYTVRWCEPDRTMQSSEGVKEGMIRCLFVDGVVVQAGSRVINDGKDIENARASFIPFKGRSLDRAHEVQIAPAGAKSLGYGDPVRHGHLLAWVTGETFYIFNLQSSTLVQVPTDGFNYATCRITAFDGETLVVGSLFAHDAKTGKRLAGSQVVGPGNLFAVRNRIGYGVRDGWIEATDLTSAVRPSVRLSATSEGPIGQGTEGLMVWTGGKWKVVPWLSSVPNERTTMQN
jgi:hypothetical protein